MSKKRNALTLRHKVDLINTEESGKSCRDLADEFNIDRTQATSISNGKRNCCWNMTMNLSNVLFLVPNPINSS